LKLRNIIFVLLIALLIFALIGCQNEGEIGENEGTDTEEVEDIEDEGPVYGGMLTVPITHVRTLNPLITGDRSLYYFNKLIFEGIFDLDNDLNIKKLLAEDYSTSDNGQVVVIKLKDNILWHDGEKFTAEDVKFTIDVIKYGAGTSIYKDMLTSIFKTSNPTDIQRIMDVRIIDDYNLEIIYDNRYSNALESLTFPIIPRHRFTKDKVPAKGVYEKALSLENYVPIGTGPYKYVSYNKLKSVNLEANDSWWNGKPYISKITGKVLENQELALTSFGAGQLDLSLTNGVDWEKYAENEKVRIYEFVSQQYEFLAFNFNDPLFAGEQGKAVRKAIAYGVDRQNIIQKVYLGHATQIDVPISPNSWLVSDDANTYGFKITEARKILEEAGWIDADKDGIYENLEGKKLTIRILTNSHNELRRKTALNR